MNQDLPKGVILGEALMTDILKYDTRNKWLEDMDRHMDRPDRFQDGLYGFILIDQTEYVNPIPWKGRLGFFDIETNNGMRFGGIATDGEYAVSAQ